MAMILGSAQGQESPQFALDSFFARVGAGIPIPLGLSWQVLNAGFWASAQAGVRFALGPGALEAGLDLGLLAESTRDVAGVDQYDSYFLPLGAFAGYELPFAPGFHAYGEAQAGYAPTLAFYRSETLTDLGVWTPYLGLCLGAGYGLGIFTFQAGARLHVIFYDRNAYMAIAPELRADIRFGGAE